MPITLNKISTKAPKDFEKDSTAKKTEKLLKQLGKLQHVLYAEKKHSVLVIFQGMDASGKDGAARNVFSKCGIAGLNLISFGKPSEEEMSHDFLWRAHKAVPAKGKISIFNRSYYEDILIQRVQGWIDIKRVHQRMDAINAFENLLTFDNKTLICKFYMHISKEGQEVQLSERLKDPEKFWKHNQEDWTERKRWDEYMKAYEYAINKSVIPWNICPVDNRWYRDYFIASTLVKKLTALNLELPKKTRSNIRSTKPSGRKRAAELAIK